MPRPPLPGPWSNINDFLIQRENLDLEAIGQTKYDLVIMDYSADLSREARFTPGQIARLKNSPGGERTVLAYLNIGEAEDYRYYWQPSWGTAPPSWLAAENPDWPGNYKVRYWDPEWQAIIFGSSNSYLGRILAAGFDGVYLDIIEAFEYFEER